jgi:cyclohexanone monooxygenase
VLDNMITIEQHVDWIADCLTHMRAQSRPRSSPTERPRRPGSAHVAEVADRTLFPKANSWYMGANIPGKPRVFMPYIGGATSRPPWRTGSTSCRSGRGSISSA